MGYTASISMRVNAVLSGTPTYDDASIIDPLTLLLATAFTDGVGANQCNQHWHDRRTLAGGASETLDLSGSLTQFQGTTVTLSRIKVLYIYNRSTTKVLTIDPDPAGVDGWTAFITDNLVLRPGGAILATAPDATGWTVAGGTNDKLRITNDAGDSCDYDIYVAGGIT